MNLSLDQLRNVANQGEQMGGGTTPNQYGGVPTKPMSPARGGRCVKSGSYLRYTGRPADVVARAAVDPQWTSFTSAWYTRLRMSER
jgi:hypothetical protein